MKQPKRQKRTSAQKKRRVGKAKKIVRAEVAPARVAAAFGESVETAKPASIVLLTLFLLALFVRLIYVIELQYSPLGEYLSLDTLTHRKMAERIATTGSTGEDVFFRAPLYPYFLGAAFKIFGPIQIAPQLIQAALGAMVSPLLLLLGVRLFPRPVAMAAAIAVALYWPLIYFGGELLITSLLVPLDLLLLLLLSGSAIGRLPGSRSSLGAGLVLGLSALARPNILVFLPAIIGWYGYLGLANSRETAVSENTGRKVWIAIRTCAWPCCTLIIGTVLVVAPVTVRNWIVGDDFVLIASQGGINFYMGNNPSASGHSAKTPGRAEQIPQELEHRVRNSVWSREVVYLTSIHIAEKDSHRRLKASEVSSYWYKRGLSFISEEPMSALALFGKKIYYLLNAYETPSNKDIAYFVQEGRLRTLQTLSLFHPNSFPYGLVCPLALLGIMLSLQQWRRHIYLHLFLVSYSLSILLFFVNARYRMPLVPVLLLFAAHAVYQLIRRWKDQADHGRFRRLMWPLILLALLLTLSHSRQFNVRDRSHLGLLAFNMCLHNWHAGNLDAAEAACIRSMEIYPHSEPHRLLQQIQERKTNME